MTRTYTTNNGTIHKNHDRNLFEEFDQLGRDKARACWQNQGWHVYDHDRLPNGTVVFDKTDLVAVKDNMIVLLEAEIKSDNCWAYVRSGVDVPQRKLKYLKSNYKCVVCMSMKTGNQSMIIPMKYLLLAQNSCGEEYYGHGKVQTTPNFVMPSHKCYRVRKNCWDERNKKWYLDDFYRINYSYITHLECFDGFNKIIHKSEVR